MSPATAYPATAYPYTAYPYTAYPATAYPDTTYPDTAYPDTAYPDTIAASYANTFWLRPGFMADSPNRDAFSPFLDSSPEGQAARNDPQRRSSRSDALQRAPSRTATPTQYEFIMTTGAESATVTKQKLKTVRSHVMKNYLQNQQRKSSEESSLSVASSERRKGKQRSRSSRSNSREMETGVFNPAFPDANYSGATEMGSLFSGFSSLSPFADYTINGQTNMGSGTKQPFALDFGFNVPHDDVSNYAQLYVKSLIRDQTSGLREPSFETLNSKGQTVRIIKDTLHVFGNDVSESTVFAVSLLASGCAVDCDWNQARGHLEALQRLIDGRGGVDTVDFELRRTFTWTTYCLASVLHLPSIFPPPHFPNTNIFPLAFLDDAQIRAWRTIKRFPKNNPFVFDIVSRLQKLSLAISSEWYNEIDQRALSNLYFDSLQAVVDIQLVQPWNATVPSGALGQESALMFQVWTAGLPLFVWATSRHVRTRLGLRVTRSTYEPLFMRIKNLLESSGGYHAWPRGKSLEPILATLFYCVESCDYNNHWRMWCMDTLRQIAELLKLKTVEEFRKALDVFPSTEEYKVAAGEIWVEMIHGSATSPPSLVFSTLQ